MSSKCRHNFSEKLHNTYFSLRHGRSYPQELGIILSDPVEGVKDQNGLVEEGRNQVKLSVETALSGGVLGQNTVIKTSPFSRTLQTAAIAQKVLKAGPIIVEPNLRERYFGRYEGKSSEYYRAVWDLDVINPAHRDMGVESADDVQARFWKVIMETEKEFSRNVILLVGHGDTSQIGETAFHNFPASVHRKLVPLDNAEIRELRAKY